MLKLGKKYKLISVFILILALALTQVSFSNVLAENNEQDDLEAILKPLRRIKQLDPLGQEIDKSQLKLGEEFIIDYTIQPRDILVEEVFNDDITKDKEIVLVMDVSGSMDENIDFTMSSDIDDSPGHTCINVGSHVRNISVERKNNKSGNYINHYIIEFDKPHNYNNRMYYLMVYSKKQPSEVESYFTGMGYWDIADIVWSSRGKLINWNKTRNSFNKYHYSLEGSSFSADNQYVYVVTLDKDLNVIGLSCSADSIRKTDSEQNDYTKIEVMKIVANNFLDKFNQDPSINVSVVSYSNVASTRQYNGKIFGNLSLGSDYSEITNQIDNFRADGGTNIGDGLRKAYYTLSNDNTKKYIILMTDGVPTAFTLSNLNGRVSGRGGYVGYLQDGYNQKFYRDLYSATYVTDNSDGNKYFVNYGTNDESSLSKKYAQEIAQMISNDARDIKTFMIGFSNSADSSKLDSIAEYADGYYKEAEDGNALDEVYQQLAQSIQASFSIPEINFQEVFQDGIEVVNVEGLTNVNVQENVFGTLVTGNAPSVAYNLVEKLDEASGRVIRYYHAEPVHFRIKAKANVLGNYNINDNQELSFIQYEDVGSIIGGTEGSLRKELFTPNEIDVYTEEIPTVNLLLKQNDDNNYLLTVSVEDPINFILTDGKGEELWKVEDIEQYDNGQFKTYDDFEDFTKEFEFSIDDLIELDILYLNCVDSSGNEFTKAVSFIYLEVEENDDDDFSDNLRPASLIITTDEGSEVTNIIINGIENTDFESKVTEDGVYIHNNVYLKAEDFDENIIEVTIKNNDGSITTQIFKRTITKDTNGSLISHHLYLGDNLENQFTGETLNLVNSYKAVLGIRFSLQSKEADLKIKLNDGNNNKVEQFQDVTFDLYRLEGETLVKLNENKLNKVQDTVNPNIYNIEIILGEEDSLNNEYILVYKITPHLTEGNEAIISNKAVLSEELELDINIKILPLPTID